MWKTCVFSWTTIWPHFTWHFTFRFYVNLFYPKIRSTSITGLGVWSKIYRILHVKVCPYGTFTHESLVTKIERVSASSRRDFWHKPTRAVLLLYTYFFKDNLLFYHTHFEITGGLCNLIGSNWCDLFTNRTIFCFKSHLFLANEEATLITKQPIRF